MLRVRYGWKSVIRGIASLGSYSKALSEVSTVVLPSAV